MRADVASMRDGMAAKDDVAEVRSLRADVAADLVISEREARVRRIVQHLETHPELH